MSTLILACRNQFRAVAVHHVEKIFVQSFQDLEDWMDVVKRVYASNMPYLALLANKADLTHMRLVTPSQHVDFADTLSMHRWAMHCCMLHLLVDSC